MISKFGAEHWILLASMKCNQNAASPEFHYENNPRLKYCLLLEIWIKTRLVGRLRVEITYYFIYFIYPSELLHTVFQPLSACIM